VQGGPPHSCACAPRWKSSAKPKTHTPMQTNLLVPCIQKAEVQAEIGSVSKQLPMSWQLGPGTAVLRTCACCWKGSDKKNSAHSIIRNGEVNLDISQAAGVALHTPAPAAGRARAGAAGRSTRCRRCTPRDSSQTAQTAPSCPAASGACGGGSAAQRNGRVLGHAQGMPTGGSMHAPSQPASQPATPAQPARPTPLPPAGARKQRSWPTHFKPAAAPPSGVG
jgi:hypothetical protein